MFNFLNIVPLLFSLRMETSLLKQPSYHGYFKVLR
nr:MAG TPA: hypothetical protein [Caudoviricetes sp.]